MWTTQAMHDEERLVDVEDGLDTCQRAVAFLQSELAAVQAEIAGMRASLTWIQRVYYWIAGAARTFPWH